MVTRFWTLDISIPAGKQPMPASFRLLRFCSISALILAMGVTHALAAPDGSDAWQMLDAVPAARVATVPMIRPLRFQPLKADNKRLRAVLATAPMESTADAATPLVLAIPAPDGTLAHFQIVESPVMEPALAAQFPEIKTYAGVGLEDPHAQLRLDMTPLGFRAQVLTPEGDWYVDPYTKGDAELLTSYRRADLAPRGQQFHCGFKGTPIATRADDNTKSVRSGETLKTYRLAVAATGEYTAYFGGTVPLAMAAIVSAINRVTGVYERDLAVRLVLVANTSSLIFTNSSTDPYTNDDGEAMLDENQTKVDSVIGSANYNIGHVFSTGGGGIAALGVVCESGYKAQGVTGSDAPDGDGFWIDYVAHEMGHQFGANHTFNSVTDSCGGGNRNASTAMEPGSGSTIMAYAGICGTDDLQPHTDAYFHTASFAEIRSYITSSAAACSVDTATGNHAPTVSGGADYNIPRSTPFFLTATGSDSDGDSLTYCWEERDLGASQALSAADNGSSPLFRSVSPKVSPQRYFPDIKTVIANTTDKQEKLPTTTRNLNFRVMVRDNRLAGGGAATDDVLVKVSSAAGPFAVTFPNASATLGGQQTVTWSVANTTASPVSCANVNILLSTDGGLTFPTTLASNVPNDGSETVTLPNTPSTTARIMVQGAGNIFYDMSNANFTIQSVSRDNWMVR